MLTVCVVPFVYHKLVKQHSKAYNISNKQQTMQNINFKQPDGAMVLSVGLYNDTPKMAGGYDAGECLDPASLAGCFMGLGRPFGRTWGQLSVYGVRQDGFDFLPGPLLLHHLLPLLADHLCESHWESCGVGNHHGFTHPGTESSWSLTRCG